MPSPGYTVLAMAHAARPRPPSRAWFDATGMALTLRDPEVARGLFRLVDVLPCLRTPQATAAAVVEYLPATGLGGWLRRCAAVVPPVVVDRAVRLGVRQLAQRFLIDPQAVPAAVARWQGQGFRLTLDWLGEAVLTEAEADDYLATCMGLVPVLAEAHRTTGQANLSVKLSALTPRFEAAAPAASAARVLARLRPLLRVARAQGVAVNLDMEATPWVETTYHIVHELRRDAEFATWDGLAMAVQAYLRRTPEDLATLEAVVRRGGPPLGIRLVKGAYWDHEMAVACQRGWPAPVWRAKGATDAAYERLAAWLLARTDVFRPAFATHNVRTITAILEGRAAHGLPRSAIEFQMLVGMADPLARSLVELGEAVRLYAPVGHLLPGMAYLVRRLLENGASQGFVRQGFVERRPAAALLASPDATEPPPEPATMFANCPPIDWSDPAARAAMMAALAAHPRGQRLEPCLGGREVPQVQRWEVRDPAHGAQVLADVGMADAATAQRAMALAAAAAAAWRHCPVAARAAALRRAAALIRTRRFALAAGLVHEIGKTWREADAEVAEAEDFCRYYADEAERLHAPREVTVPGEANTMVWEPRGVTVVIAPWNFPLAILVGMTAAALVMGNPVVMKPAEQAPCIARAALAILLEAGIPADVVGYVPGRGDEVGPVLTGHPATAVIAFTGSRAVGLHLVRAAAEPVPDRHHVVQVIAEMGGKNAIIIDSSADLDEAVAGVVASATGFQGQKCSACSRAIVLADIAAPFMARLAAAWQTLAHGDPHDPDHPLGPVIDADARDRLRDRLAAAAARLPVLATVPVPAALAAQGYYVPPTILGPVPADDPAAQEEWFGPVLAVITARDLDHALSIANGTDYALTGGAFARSPAVLDHLRREFRVGNLYLNRGITGALVHRQPFGGFRLSGIGSKAGGPDYLPQFAIARAICDNTLRHGMV